MSDARSDSGTIELLRELRIVIEKMLDADGTIDTAQTPRNCPWEEQFHSAAAAASEYSEFWERHHGDFDQFDNYIPHSQMDGDLRAAKAKIEQLEAALHQMNDAFTVAYNTAASNRIEQLEAALRWYAGFHKNDPVGDTARAALDQSSPPKG
jgi:hypothetical protein